MPPICRRDGNRGIALVVVLWVLVLLAMIAASVTVGARTGVSLASNLNASARAEALADAGIARAVMTLSTRRRVAGDAATIVEPGEERPALDLEGLIVDLPRDRDSWPVDGRPVAWAFEDARLAVAVMDEGGKIDLNAASDALLRGLFESVGLGADEAMALTDAVRDYGDDDDLRRAQGAEAADYRAAGLAAPKNARFEAVQELLQVYGMTPELYQAVAPALTVYSGRPGIDPRVAPAAALLALPGNDLATVQAVIAARAADPDATAQLSGRDQLTSRSRGRVFRIEAEAVTADGARFVRSAVVRLAGRPAAQVLRWECAPSPPPETDKPAP